MSYRPICDVWILARAKLRDGARYYGAYPAGFLHRARQLLGVRWEDPVLHVCAGLVKKNLYRGFGPHDRTLDLDPATEPDYLMDARRIGVGSEDLYPRPDFVVIGARRTSSVSTEYMRQKQVPLWPAIMIDRPYTAADHEHYNVPAEVFPSDLNDLLKRCLRCVEPGGRVGVLDYIWPHPGKWGKEVAVVGVGTGRNNRARWYTVFERLPEEVEDPLPKGRGHYNPMTDF